MVWISLSIYAGTHVHAAKSAKSATPLPSASVSTDSPDTLGKTAMGMTAMGKSASVIASMASTVSTMSTSSSVDGGKTAMGMTGMTGTSSGTSSGGGSSSGSSMGMSAAQTGTSFDTTIRRSEVVSTTLTVSSSLPPATFTPTEAPTRSLTTVGSFTPGTVIFVANPPGFTTTIRSDIPYATIDGGGTHNGTALPTTVPTTDVSQSATDSSTTGSYVVLETTSSIITSGASEVSTQMPTRTTSPTASSSVQAGVSVVLSDAAVVANDDDTSAGDTNSADSTAATPMVVLGSTIGIVAMILLLVFLGVYRWKQRTTEKVPVAISLTHETFALDSAWHNGAQRRLSTRSLSNSSYAALDDVDEQRRDVGAGECQDDGYVAINEDSDETTAYEVPVEGKPGIPLDIYYEGVADVTPDTAYDVGDGSDASVGVAGGVSGVSETLVGTTPQHESGVLQVLNGGIGSVQRGEVYSNFMQSSGAYDYADNTPTFRTARQTPPVYHNGASAADPCTTIASTSSTGTASDSPYYEYSAGRTGSSNQPYQVEQNVYDFPVDRLTVQNCVQQDNDQYYSACDHHDNMQSPAANVDGNGMPFRDAVHGEYYRNSHRQRQVPRVYSPPENATGSDVAAEPVLLTRNRDGGWSPRQKTARPDATATRALPAADARDADTAVGGKSPHESPHESHVYDAFVEHPRVRPMRAMQMDAPSQAHTSAYDLMVNSTPPRSAPSLTPAPVHHAVMFDGCSGNDVMGYGKRLHDAYGIANATEATADDLDGRDPYRYYDPARTHLFTYAVRIDDDYVDDIVDLPVNEFV